MAGIDQLSISRRLDSTVQPFSRPRFGGFSVVTSTAQMSASLPRPASVLRPDADRDAVIVQAFKEERQGHSLDRMLADPDLTSSFIRRCRGLGVAHRDSDAAICRRLLRIRKSGALDVHTPKGQDKGDLRPFLIPAELAFAQLTYRYDASYDDLLCNPELGAAFDRLAAKLGGGGNRVEYRLAALHLRKNIRSRTKGVVPDLAKISASDIEKSWHPLGPISGVAIGALPTTEGILCLSEPRRHLYLTRHPNLRAGLDIFRDGKVLAAMGNRFWSPSPEAVEVKVMEKADAKGSTLKLYELKSLEVYRPIFNMLPTAA